MRAGLASTAAAAVADSLLAASLEPPVTDVFLSSAPTRFTGMTTGEEVLAPVFDLTESDDAGEVGC